MACGKGLFIMEFNGWYDYWFEYKGFCPVCGEYMVMSMGCYNSKCPMAKRIAKEDDWTRIKINNLNNFRKKILKKNEKFFAGVKSRKEKNLDTSSKKHYLEIDNQGISE